jgi:hypothetical protein
MGQWAIVVTAERYAAERLYAHDALDLSGLTDHIGTGAGPRPGDPVALVAAGSTASSDSPVLFGLGRVRNLRRGPHADPDDPEAEPVEDAHLVVAYTHRLLDEPVAGVDLLPGVIQPGLVALDEEGYGRLAGRVAAAARIDADKADWLVSVALPIEAASPAEAVREFWSYVDQLGPRELPAFVSPAHDELSMRAFVLGEPANLDPEEDD